MGAFDSELYALGYRFNAPVVKQNSKTPETHGPSWAGECVGNCSAAVCHPCRFNNKLDDDALRKAYRNYQKWFEFEMEKYPSLQADKQRKVERFIKLYPGFTAWLELENRMEKQNHD